jgi:Holliday junction DNA helicase RuvA
MISSLSGTLASKSPTEVVVDVHGVGYSILIPVSTYERLGGLGSSVTLLTYLHVREDAMQLFGFATEEERTLFKLLLTVSGIGPKMGQAILSGISVSDFHRHLLQGNIAALTTVPGIGKKLAERLVLELREKVSKLEIPLQQQPPSDPKIRIQDEAIHALMSLGYARAVAEKAVQLTARDTDGEGNSVESLVKGALKHVAKG